MTIKKESVKSGTLFLCLFLVEMTVFMLKVGNCIVFLLQVAAKLNVNRYQRLINVVGVMIWLTGRGFLQMFFDDVDFFDHAQTLHAHHYRGQCPAVLFLGNGNGTLEDIG